jgi:hypothetical protein
VQHKQQMGCEEAIMVVSLADLFKVNIVEKALTNKMLFFYNMPKQTIITCHHYLLHPLLSFS